MAILASNRQVYVYDLEKYNLEKEDVIRECSSLIKQLELESDRTCQEIVQRAENLKRDLS